MSYDDVIARKSASTPSVGFTVDDLAPHLFPHQQDLVRWALRRGRAAIFADTGLGKGLMLLEWARHVTRHGRVIVLAPLAVGPQLVAEGARFGVSARYLRADDSETQIVVTNYEMLHAFDASQFVGVVLDESSILKSYDGKTKQRLMDAFKRTPYRLACTATPAPNDFTELGNHSEFLGLKSRTEMLAEYFVHDGGSTQDWRIKGHAVAPFWRWVSTWGAVVKMPSDLGFDDGAFCLPPLTMQEHVVPSTDHDIRASGQLFALEARTLQEQRAVRRGTIASRVMKSAELARSYACGDRIPGTCASTTSETKTNGNVTAHSKTRSMRANGKPTPRIQAFASTTNNALANGKTRTLSANEMRDSAKTTESPSPNTNACSPAKEGGAQSANAPRTKTVDDSTLTTVTRPAQSADSSAVRATSDLDNLTTAPIDSGARSRIWNVSVVVWCELNDEQDSLASELGDLCVSIQGADSDEDKVERHERWLRGDVPVLLTKASCFGFGLNWQHCHRVIFIGASHSYERTYQAIRRCWRFGQTQPVTVDLVRSELEAAIVENYRRKENDAAKMAAEMTAHVGEAVRAEVRGLSREFNPYRPSVRMALPTWL